MISFSIISLNQLLLGCLLINQLLTSFAFVVPSCEPNGNNNIKYYDLHESTGVRRNTRVQVVADASIEMEGEEKSKRRKDDDWIPSPRGGFIPNLKTPKILKKFHTTKQQGSSTPAKIMKVTDIHQYKQYVVEESNNVMVCVRFYMESCRSCKATQANFRRLANEMSPDLVKFVEVPVTKDNAYLHQGLGIPSFPYSHIYCPDVGLVEELKLNKKVFKQFEQILSTYVHGECNVGYNDDLGTSNYHDTTTKSRTSAWSTT